MLSPVTPTDIYSNFAIEMACRLQGCKMKTLQVEMKDFFNLVQGKGEGDMFGEGTSGEKLTLHDAIKRVFNVDYKPIIRDNNGEKRSETLADDGGKSPQGRPRGQGDGKGREPAEEGKGTPDDRGGTQSDGDESAIDARRQKADENGLTQAVSPPEARLRDELVDRLRNAGIEVRYDAEEAQSVLEGIGDKKNVKYLRTPKGDVYGFVYDGKIYIDPRIAKADTPIHEYTHLWSDMIRRANPKEWENVVRLMKGTWAWDYVKEIYPELKTEGEIADEVLAHFSGKLGASILRNAEERMMANADGSEAKSAVKRAFERVKQALKRFWQNVADILHIHFNSAEEVAEKVLQDLLEGVNPIKEAEAIKAEYENIERDAKANGTWLKAPNGKKSKLNSKQWVQVRTHAFKDWFGDWENDPEDASMAVDENGEPKVFYHNTDSDFTVFDAGKNGSHTDAGWLGDGFYFYGDEHEGDGYGRKKMGVFLNIRDVYIASPEENEELANANDRDKSVAFREEIEDEGYDGVYYNGDFRQEAVVFYPNQIKSATDNVGTFSNENDDIRYQKKISNDDVEAVNERFNDDLDRYEKGEIPVGTRFDLGMPSKELESTGFPYLPISMRASLLSRKAGMERHPFKASDLKGLVKAIQRPIAVFKYSKDNMRNLIVDVTHGDKHFLVGVTLDYKKGNIEVNSVSGLFPKESHEWVKWIQDGKVIRIDQKKKVLDLIDSLRTNPAESERIGLNLSLVAKIVENFDNPVINGGNFSEKKSDDRKTLIGVDNEDTTVADADVRGYTSTELDREFGDRWIKDQQTASGQHSTQVKNTERTYAKIGDWLKGLAKKLGRKPSVLDASSGLGYGTMTLRGESDNGKSKGFNFDVDDVEPYPAKEREAGEPTYTDYADIDKKYDVVISNAVLNVIPDDWRASLLRNMASHLKDGGKLIVNVRDAKEIERQKQKIELESPSEILVTDRKGRIRAYQRGFTQSELEEYIKKELGDGYTVESAGKVIPEMKGSRAVVVTKETTRGYTTAREPERRTPDEEHRSSVEQAVGEVDKRTGGSTTVIGSSEVEMYSGFFLQFCCL